MRRARGKSITVTAVAPGTGIFAWTGPAASLLHRKKVRFTINNIQPNQQGNYIVTATNACGSNTDTIAVTVYATPDSLFVGASSDLPYARGYRLC